MFCIAPDVDSEGSKDVESQMSVGLSLSLALSFASRHQVESCRWITWANIRGREQDTLQGYWIGSDVPCFRGISDINSPTRVFRLAMRFVCPDSCRPIDCVKEGTTRSWQDLLEDARLVVERKGELSGFIGRTHKKDKALNSGWRSA